MAQGWLNKVSIEHLKLQHSNQILPKIILQIQTSYIMTELIPPASGLHSKILDSAKLQLAVIYWHLYQLTQVNSQACL